MSTIRKGNWSGNWYCPECGIDAGTIEFDHEFIYKCNTFNCYWSGKADELITTEEGRINLKRFQTLKDILK